MARGGLMKHLEVSGARNDFPDQAQAFTIPAVPISIRRLLPEVLFFPRGSA